MGHGIFELVHLLSDASVVEEKMQTNFSTGQNFGEPQFVTVETEQPTDQGVEPEGVASEVGLILVVCEKLHHFLTIQSVSLQLKLTVGKLELGPLSKIREFNDIFSVGQNAVQERPNKEQEMSAVPAEVKAI